MSGESTAVPSDNLGDLLEQLGTLNNRHEQLRALVEALEVQFEILLSSIFKLFFFSGINSIAMNLMHSKINTTIFLIV